MEPTNPTTVTAATVGGAIGIILVFILGAVNVDVGAEVGGAITLLCTAVVGLFSR